MRATGSFYSKVRGTNIRSIPHGVKSNMEYTGSKGYTSSYGRHVGSIAVMMDYLRYQNYGKWVHYDTLLKFRNKRSVPKLDGDELAKVRYDIWCLLEPETKRKFKTMDFLHR